jgi:hypothetical protein
MKTDLTHYEPPVVKREVDTDAKEHYPNLTLPNTIPIEAPHKLDEFAQKIGPVWSKRLYKLMLALYVVILPFVLTIYAWGAGFSIGAVMAGLAIFGAFLHTIWEIDILGMPWEHTKSWKGFGIATLAAWGVVALTSLVAWPIHSWLSAN